MTYMEAQEIFDKVVIHLDTQGRRASDPGIAGCFYRTPDGLSCAVGCLIPDNEYKPEMECGSVYALVRSFPRVPSIAAVAPNVDLLYSLQIVHDSSYNWENRLTMVMKLEAVADRFMLDTKVLDKLKFEKLPE